MKLTLEADRFGAQVWRPSFKETLKGFEWRTWDVRDNETSEYKQHRLYVKSVSGRYSDDLGYIDFMNGEIVPSKSRFAQKLQSFVDMVESGYAEFVKENPAFHGDGEKHNPVLPLSLLEKLQGRMNNLVIGIRAEYGEEYAVEAWKLHSGDNYYELRFYRHGKYKTSMHINDYYGLQKLDIKVIDRLNEALSFYQPDESKWQVVGVEDAKAIIYPKSTKFNDYKNRVILS